MKITRILKTKAIFALVAMFGVAATSLPAVADDLIADIQKRGTLKVGMSTFVPWAMRDKQGDLIGFEIDVATKVAEDMGVEVEFVPTAWSGIIPSLLAKKFDVIIGGMSITPQRNLTVNFTTPYAHSGQMMAANKKLAANFTTMEDYNQSSVTSPAAVGQHHVRLLKSCFQNQLCVSSMTTRRLSRKLQTEMHMQ